MTKTHIEYADYSWNPITGCTPVSPGCDHCYARRQAERWRGRPGKYHDGFDLTIHVSAFDEPLGLQQPSRIFVCSMSDLFHEDIPRHIIERIFATMNQAEQHTFLIFTKRAHRMASLAPCLNWSANIWAGVTVESRPYLFRLSLLADVPAEIRFVSFEPLIGRMPPDLSDRLYRAGIQWVIVGGESGPQARRINYRWVLQIRDVCQELQIPFFFKQWGGQYKKRYGRMLQGRTWEEMPG